MHGSVSFRGSSHPGYPGRRGRHVAQCGRASVRRQHCERGAVDGRVSAQRPDRGEAARRRPALGSDRGAGRPSARRHRADAGHHPRRVARAADQGTRRGFRDQHDPRLLPPPRRDVQKTAHASEQEREDGAPRGMVRSAARAGSREAGVPRRNRGDDQDGPPARTQPAGRGAAGPPSPMATGRRRRSSRRCASTAWPRPWSSTGR